MNDPTPEITKFVEENFAVLEVIKNIPSAVIEAWEDYRTKPKVLLLSDVKVIQRNQLEDKFWQDIYIHGMSAQDVNDELHDFKMLLDNAPLVYSHVTGGRVSKPNTDADVVIAMADDNYSRDEEENIDELLDTIAGEFDLNREELDEYR